MGEQIEEENIIAQSSSEGESGGPSVEPLPIDNEEDLFEIAEKDRSNIAKVRKQAAAAAPQRQIVKSHAGVMSRYRFRSVHKTSEDEELSALNVSGTSAKSDGKVGYGRAECQHPPVSHESAEDDNATNASHTSACFDTESEPRESEDDVNSVNHTK